MILHQTFLHLGTDGTWLAGWLARGLRQGSTTSAFDIKWTKVFGYCGIHCSHCICKTSWDALSVIWAGVLLFLGLATSTLTQVTRPRLIDVPNVQSVEGCKSNEKKSFVPFGAIKSSRLLGRRSTRYPSIQNICHLLFYKFQFRYIPKVVHWIKVKFLLRNCWRSCFIEPQTEFWLFLCSIVIFFLTPFTPFC